MRILKYLKETPWRGVFYLYQGHTRVARLSNADWAGCLFDRRTTTGYCIFLEENLVS